MGTLRYFASHSDSVIQTNASQNELETVVLQQGQPVCCASKALSDIENNYNNIERKMFGVVWGLERFNYFVYGEHCTVH